MAKYTIELYKIEEIYGSKVFDFDYELYDNSLKEEFEKYFIEYFYFHEIGFETIGRFKKSLQNKLNNIAYKYREYYKTVLVAENYDFMTTKNMTYITTREIEGENKSTSKVNSTTNANAENIFSATPKGNINNLEHYMTEGTIDRGSTTGTTNGESGNESKQREMLTHSEKGNLGAFSDAHLIERWREVIVDINEKICKNELSSLFMLLY